MPARRKWSCSTAFDRNRFARLCRLADKSDADRLSNTDRHCPCGNAYYLIWLSRNFLPRAGIYHRAILFLTVAEVLCLQAK
ncbi:MAG TPA: hypothetical protein DCF61_10720 [Alphaproteobacteria bacterium]|nr:hypothetical protein [Alphaproteobacteria bacterium]